MLADPLARPKIADAPLTVVLLARSDAATNAGVLGAWETWLREQRRAAEILVVLPAWEKTPNPSDTMGIQGELHQTQACLPRVRILHHLAPAGEGPALQTAIWLAQHPLLLTAPCDGQFQPADAQRLLEIIDKVDLVCGIRVHRPPPWWLRSWDFVKRLVTRVLLGYAAEPQAAWLGWSDWWLRFRARHVYGLKLSDPACPFRLLRTAGIRHVPVQSTGSFVHLEILAKWNHLGGWMAEVPVAWTPPAPTPPDPDWSADCWRVFHQPEFGPPQPVVPAGNAASDLVASQEVVSAGAASTPSKLGG